jgi:transglutaminase-like putative cysteine protease
VPVRVRVASSDAAILARTLGIDVAPGVTSFEYEMRDYPQLPSPPGHDFLAPTFMVDYDEPVFDELASELAALGASPRPEAVVQLVHRLVDENVPRGWDIASQVARRRVGDCTEHAVLAAALLRRTGHPARVVVGVALIDEAGKLGAFGHAWAERRAGDRWVVADATLEAGDDRVRYLPIGYVEDEGVGYATSLMRHMRAWVSKVVVLGTAPAAPAAKRK